MVVKFLRITPAILRRLNHYIPRSTVCRTLLSDPSLKIDHFAKRRIFQVDLLGKDGKAKLAKKLQTMSSSDEARHATHDIVDLLHCADVEDIPLINNLILLVSDPDVVQSRAFNFGVTLIRLYHFLNLPEEAHSVYSNPECLLLFQDATSHKVLMDLMYKNKLFTQVVEVYSMLKHFNIDCVTLVLGALYHLNTPDCLEKAQDIVKDVCQHHVLSRRAIIFVALLSLNQNEPDFALEILKQSKDSVLVTNVKIMCLSRQGDLKSTFAQLEEAVEISKNITRPFAARLYSDTMGEVRKAVKLHGLPEDAMKLERLEQQLSYRGVLSIQVTTSLIERIIPGVEYFRKDTGKPPIINNSQAD
ncbi:pentatricopeptide repeat-containing protein 2, mitochondrial [Aplysia californica]|uniref:Pentatricopeptide repeat-containing protein 2, mitochondrial n=1 Tax=Aplysia californica TaxID=6500 RepID=A0ABM0JGZ0_APLCA|nr:pentatricopeptide repeat-containing protein 2, mitochondrial [Aplysia californica]